MRRFLLIRSAVNVGLLVLGIGLVTIALFVFPWPLKPGKPDSYEPKGFIFGTSEIFFQEDASIYMIFDSFELDKNKANVTIHINYICQNRSSYSTAFFILQVPYSVDNVEIVTGAWYPAFFGGNTTIITPFEGLSYIIIRIPKENQTFGKSAYMRFQFTINNAFWKHGYYTYEFQLTFSNEFHDSINDIYLLKGMIIIDRLFFFKSKVTRLSIERPEMPYSILELTPQSDEIGYWLGKTWYVWDIKSRSSPHLISSSVVVEIEDEDAKFKYETRHSATWFLFGLGIPLALSSFYKIWQEPRLTIEVVPKSKNEPALHPITGMAFYHLVVKNNGKSTAYDCELYITLREEGGKTLFELKGKWDRGPEPLGPIQKRGLSQVWPSLIPLTELVNIRPGVPETFCLLVKGKNEKEGYAFNAHSYFYSNFKNPAWQLGLGKFIAEIDVRGGNVKVFSRFLIENKGTGVQDVTISKLD